MGFEPTKINPLGDFSKWFDDADNFGPKVGVEGILGPRIFIATSVGHPGWLFKHFCARFYKKATPIGHSGGGFSRIYPLDPPFLIKSHPGCPTEVAYSKTTTQLALE
jgi:hypothetical protein